MSQNVWAGIAIGAVIGGGAGDDVPSGDGGLGGAKNYNSDKDSDNGGQGLFSLWGHEVWLYIGGIIGFGNSFGPYLTTGPMIGKNPDWAIGGGIHFGKAIGVGVVVPIRQAMQSYVKHQEKVTLLLDSAQQTFHSIGNYAYDLVNQMPSLVANSGLEQLVC